MPLLQSFRRSVSQWGETALGLMFPWPESVAGEPVPIVPPFCRQCGYPNAVPENYTPDFICSGCAEQDWYFSWARAAYRTEGEVHEAIVGFKYQEQFYQRSRLVNWLTEAFDRHVQDGPWDLLVPVPLYHRRRRERGFNQARELANGLAKRRGLRVADSLRRIRETSTQTGLERRARRDNMKGAFELKRGFDVTGQKLLLIDDVFTTGATANACARALVESGADQVAVLTVART